MSSDYVSHIPRAELEKNSTQKKLPLAVLAEPDPNYNPLQYPADIDLAKEHGYATRVCKVWLPGTSRPCPCCGKNVQNEEISVFCEFRELTHLGVSYPLYYYFKRSSVLIMLVAFLVSGIYQINSNMQQDNNSQWIIEYNTSSTGKFSLLGFYFDPNTSAMVTQAGLFFAANFIIFIMIQYYKGQQKRIVWDAHRDSHTPADYTVLVNGLDNLSYTEKDIKDFFSQVDMHQFPPIDVKKVCLTYDIKDLDDLHRKRAKLIHSRRKLDSKLTHYGHSHEIAPSIREKANDLDIQIADCEAELEKLEKEYMDTASNFFRLSGTVFVSLNTQRQSKNLQKRWKMSGWKRLLVSVFGCVFKRFAYRERVLSIERAPQPSDVLFENLCISSFDKIKKIIKSYIMTFFTIVISSLILFGLSLLRIHLEDTGNSYSSIFGYASSFVIVIINQLLITVIKKFCADEHHYSYTHFYRSIARKLIVAQFINTALVPLAVRLLVVYIDSNVSEATGLPNNQILEFMYLLANDMLYILEINAISTPMLYIFDTTYMLRLLKRRSVGKDPAGSDLSQCEVNSLFEGPALDIASRYAGFIKTIWATAFYAFLIPLSVPISLVGLWFGYIIDRYLLARRFSTPIQLGKDLSKSMAGYIKEWLFFAGLGLVLFGGYFYESVNPGQGSPAIYTLGGIILAISILNMAIKFKFYKLFVKKDHVLSDMTWEQVHLDFITDYDRANPVTQAVAEEAVIREALEVEVDPMRRSAIMNLLSKVQVRNAMEKSHIQGLYKYASTHQNLGDHYTEHSEGHAPMPAYIQDQGKMGFVKKLGAGMVNTGFLNIPVTTSQMGPYPGFVPNPGPIGFSPVNAYGNQQVVVEEMQPHHKHHHHHNNNF